MNSYMFRRNKKGGNVMNKQTIEVEYDTNLVEEYKKNYIMEEEGIGDVVDTEPFGEQTTFNEDSVEEILGEGAEILDEN